MTKSSDPFLRTIRDHRKLLKKIQPPVGPSEKVSRQKAFVPLSKDLQLPISIYRPQDLSPPYPTIFYIPGTAFVGEAEEITHLMCEKLAEMGFQVIALHHRLAPEYPFPQGLNDAYNLMKAMTGTKTSPATYQCKVDTSKIALMGYSSGGNFAASIAIRAKKEGLSITHLMLIAPILDLSRSLEKYTTCENQDSTISNAFIEWFLNHYLPKNITLNQLKNPLLSPFWQKKDNLKGLPLTDIFSGSNDRFIEHSLAFATKLKEAGVDVSKHIKDNIDHRLWWYNQKSEEVQKFKTVLQIMGARLTTSLGLYKTSKSLLGSLENLPKTPILKSIEPSKLFKEMMRVSSFSL